MSDYGELGPLDIQMTKKDELWEMQSGLTVIAALESLKEKAYSAFEEFFLQTKLRSRGTGITARTASEIATRLSEGLFAPISKQIDPIDLGEATRAVRIANDYGTRLSLKTDNCSEEGLEHIVSGYPSHGFVIDRQEANLIFQNVREPSKLESELCELLGTEALRPNRIDPKMPVDAFRFLIEEPPEAEITKDKEDKTDNGDQNVKEGNRDAEGDKSQTTPSESREHIQKPEDDQAPPDRDENPSADNFQPRGERKGIVRVVAE